MPQAADEMRAEWGGEQGVGEDKALAFLKARGFKLTKRWTWIEPPGHNTTKEEWGAIDFLVCEWDFGGLDRLDHPAATNTNLTRKTPDG